MADVNDYASYIFAIFSIIFSIISALTGKVLFSIEFTSMINLLGMCGVANYMKNKYKGG